MQRIEVFILVVVIEHNHEEYYYTTRQKRNEAKKIFEKAGIEIWDDRFSEVYRCDLAKPRKVKS